MKRHDKIVEALSGTAVELGWQTIREQVWTIPETGQRLKPDLVCKRGQTATVIDVTVRWKYDRNGINSLDNANTGKVTKYKPLTETLKGALGVTQVNIFGFAIGARGGWAESRTGALIGLGLKKTKIATFSSRC